MKNSLAELNRYVTTEDIHTAYKYDQHNNFLNNMKIKTKWK